MTKLYEVPYAYELQKEELIIDFIEHSSEAMDVDCADWVSESARNVCKFAILKIAMMKISQLTDTLFGLRLPEFKANDASWNKFRGSSQINPVKEAIEKRRKIIEVYFKSAFKSL